MMMFSDKPEKRLGAIRFLARTAVIAALYAVLTIFMAPIAYGPLQFRLAEAMTIFPLFFPEAILGLTIGCLIANVFSAFGWYDMVFGTAATLIAAILTYLISKSSLAVKKPKLLPFIGAIPPVVVNALLLPLIWYFFASDAGYLINMLMIFGTQSAVIYLLGIPLYFGLKKVKL